MPPQAKSLFPLIVCERVQIVAVCFEVLESFQTTYRGEIGANGKGKTIVFYSHNRGSSLCESVLSSKREKKAGILLRVHGTYI